eukprot:12648864-Ditylum_brightwellii.AAC.1
MPQGTATSASSSALSSLSTTTSTLENLAFTNGTATTGTAAAIHFNYIWDGHLPAANSKVAKEFKKNSICNAEALCSRVSRLPNNRHIVPLPTQCQDKSFGSSGKPANSNLVKVAHGFGIGTSGIGKTSPIDDKFLVLAGEGGSKIGDPQCLVFPHTLWEEVEMPCPLEEAINSKLQSPLANWHYFLPRDLGDKDTENIIQIAPLPAFLVYNRFEKGICAEELYERVLSLDDHMEPYFVHFLNFLRAYMVKRNVNNPKPFANPMVFVAMPLAEANLPQLNSWHTSPQQQQQHNNTGTI